MVEMTEKISTHLLLVEPITINLVGRQDAIKDIFVFLCLWPPVIIEECDISSFSATMSDIWGMKEHVLVWEEDNRVFIFQFKEDESKNHAHHGASGRSAMFFMMLELHLVQRTFAFTLEVAVELELRYKKC
ncbi:hypothetical protein ACLB2K_055094 [Fragaria x ananassa]